VKLRRDLRGWSAGVAVVVAAAFAAVYFVEALSDFDHAANKNSALSFDDREVAGGHSIIINQEAAYEARVLIPRTATYRLRTGAGLRNATPLTANYVESWFRYFLMPRRPSNDANWIICYGCDTTELRPSYNVRWRDSNGISIGRLR
jgi:hypothetical protein